MLNESFYLLGYLMAGVQLCGLIAAIHAIFTVRTSQGAIAWAVSLLFMPVLTLLPYLVFGRSSFDDYIRARRQANREMHQVMDRLDWRPWVDEALAVNAVDVERRLRPFARLAGMPSLASNHVQLLIDGRDTFEAIFAAIAAARKAVLVQFFIIHDDRLGRRLQQVLLERAAAGVEVYLLFDSVGSHALPSAYVRRLREGGVRVGRFAPHKGLISRFQINFRNHRKIVVVDGQTGFVGGHNVGDEYCGAKARLSPWRDTHIELQGPVVACLQESFAEDWYWADRSLPPLLLPDVYASGPGMLCQAICSGPADGADTGSLFFVQAIASARQRIWLTSPYFVPDEAVMSALRLAVLRGLDVRILLPSRPDHRSVYAASSLYARTAAAFGVRVFRYQPGFLHQKVVLIDSELAAVGSANLDNRSFRLNFEVMVLTADPDFAAQVVGMLERDFAEAVEMSPETEPRPRRLRQLGMRVARLFAPIL